MRVLDVSGFEYVTGPSLQEHSAASMVYHDAMATIAAAYEELLSLEVPIEDARGILPTNICTNIVVRYNLRTLSDIFISRSSPRTQAEYRDVIEAMYMAVTEAHPWADLFLRNRKHDAAKQLDSVILNEYDGTAKCAPYLKLVDQLRG